MKSVSTTLAIIAVASLTTFSRADDDALHEVPMGLSLFSSPTVWSVTNAGTVLVVINSAGPGSAFTFDGHQVKVVPANPGDTMFFMNALGSIVGVGNNGPFIQDAAGNQTLVTSPTGDYLFPIALDDHNIVVGQAFPAGNPYGFFWNNGTVTAYNFPGANSTAVNFLNDNGNFVGGATDAGTGAAEAFSVIGGNAAVLSIPGMYTTGLDRHGVVTGLVYNSSLTYTSYILSPNGHAKVIDFTDRAPRALPGPKAPLRLVPTRASTVIWSLNDFGWVGGQFTSAYQDASFANGVTLPIAGRP